ncbi:hypothetical protein INT43_003268 [Umbelopsis isabellina]|uniref:Protein JTB n=1 Tax=Mortierella isabellina TaxID=91625 RepID=A0A8H7PQF7_MORIS|nr:hypothetical protein INT43_003268 [Umbelopsis isabellina]
MRRTLLQHTAIFILLVFFLSAAAALGNAQSNGPSLQSRQLSSDMYTCSVVGECKVCTDLEKKTQPYCKEYGNKQAISCKYNEDITGMPDALPLFQACPRVRWVERRHYHVFVVSNVVVSMLAVGVFLWRHRKLTGEQYRRMAQRIGISV